MSAAIKHTDPDVLATVEVGEEIVKITYTCGCVELANGRYESVCPEHLKEIGITEES